MPANKHFGATRKKKQDPIVLTIDAIPLDDNKDIETSEFSFMPEVPGGLLIEVATMVGENGKPDVRGAVHLLMSAVRPEDEGRLTEFLRSKDPYVQDATLADVFKWLIETYGKRPTATLSVFTDGRRKATSTSTDDG